MATTWDERPKGLKPKGLTSTLSSARAAWLINQSKEHA